MDVEGGGRRRGCGGGTTPRTTVVLPCNDERMCKSAQAIEWEYEKGVERFSILDPMRGAKPSAGGWIDTVAARLR